MVSVPARALVSISCLAFSVGCSQRSATEQDCDVVLERIVRVELRSRTPDAPARELDSRVADAKAELAATTAEQCVGRPITDAALDCVRTAGTSEELEGCWR